MNQSCGDWVICGIGRHENAVVIELLCTSINMWSNVTPNTLAYWNFDDQNASQITDATWNWRNLTWTAPTYAQLSWTDYYWIFNWSQKWSISRWVSDNFTIVLYMQITQATAQYIFAEYLSWTQFSLIYWYKSQQVEIYTDWMRFTIKSWTPLNTRMMIWITKSWSTIKTYYNWQYVAQWSKSLSSPTSFRLWWSDVWDNLRWWYLNNVIIEQWIRNDADFLNYWNKTKWKYWLS